MENAEINNIIKIIGLQYKKNYSDPESLKSLRYGKIMIMTDQVFWLIFIFTPFLPSRVLFVLIIFRMFMFLCAYIYVRIGLCDHNGFVCAYWP